MDLTQISQVRTRMMKIQGVYNRTVNDIVTIDNANDEQVELSNILVFEAEHQTIDAEGRQAIDIESGGKGLLFHAGIVKEIEWENIDGILTPVEDGVPAELVPGKTWIHIIRTDAGNRLKRFLYPLTPYEREGEVCN